jgi:nucleotidyltransferase-like protein
MTFSPEAAIARRSLLDALEGLSPQLDALVLVGAQAVYLHTGDSDVAIASHTVDADLAVVPERLHDDPHLEDAMRSAGFVNDLTRHQPGTWISRDGVPVELLVPEQLHTGGGRRGARIPPHSKRAARSVPGLEAAAVDHAPHTITAIEDGDNRTATINVAGPAALIVAKLHKLGERHDRDEPHRLDPNDAHDLFRLLQALGSEQLTTRLRALADDERSSAATTRALGWIRTLCATPDSLIPTLAAEAETVLADEERQAFIATSTSVLATQASRLTGW